MLKEIHLHLDPEDDHIRRDYIIYQTFAETKRIIEAAEDDYTLNHIVHTTQPHFLSFDYLPARLFVHFYNNNREEIHEITLGSCEGTDKELRKAHNLEKMLLAGSFDW